MRKLIVLLGIAGLLLISVSQLSADEIDLGDFPSGQWLDTNWQAYWTFAPKSIKLLDVHDKVLWDFADIVQNMKVWRLEDGGLRLSWDCAKAGRSYVFEKPAGSDGVRMNIRQNGSTSAYKMGLPVVNTKQLSDYKQAVLTKSAARIEQIVTAIETNQTLATAAETPAAKIETPDTKAAAAAATETEEQLLNRRTAEIIAIAAGGDLTLLDQAIAEADQQGLAGKLILALEAESARPDTPPHVYMALSTLYGRKGLKTQQYAALEQAEKAPQPPNVTFNIALVHGRKQLLAGAPDAKSFLVGEIEIIPTTDGATVKLDGETMGTAPIILHKVAAGPHTVELSAEGQVGYAIRIELAVGQYQHLVPDMVSKLRIARNNYDETQKLLKDGVEKNFNKIQDTSMDLTKDQKRKLYRTADSDPGLAAGAFVINLILPISVGSMIQGDWAGALWTSLFKCGGVVTFIYGTANLGGTSDYTLRGIEMIVGIVLYAGGEIASLITPWTYSADYNKRLKQALNLDIAADILPYATTAWVGDKVGLELGIGFQF